MVDQVIREIAESFGVEPEVVAAICVIESASISSSARYESHYKYLYKVNEFAKMNRISIETEMIFQKTSWGIMQTMGGVCRENGFNGFLPSLCEKRIGLTWGCMQLQKLFNRHSNLADVVASYNAGSPRRRESGEYINQTYVDKFFNAYTQIGGNRNGET